MKETKFKQTLVQTKEGSRHCEERSDVAIQSGFKMTEVGMIPHDWEVFLLSDLCSKIFSGKNKEKHEIGNYLVYGSTGVLGYSNKFAYDKPAILIARVGANAGIINEVDGKYDVSDNTLIVYGISCCQHYIYEFLKFWNLNKLVFGSGQPLITGGQLKKIEIPLPPTIEEQQRIANALSDVDTLIANLEKLIAKKKNIKQGAMQQLLTGKKRLPGFGSDERQKECHSERSAKREVEESSGYKMTELGMIPTDWEVKTLNELCECNRSSTLSLPKEFVYVDLESVCQGKLLKRQIVKACDAPSRAQRFFEKDDILYQTVRPYQKNNLKVDFDAKNYIASTGYAVLHSKESLLNCDYLYQYIHTDRFVDVVMDNCSGTSYPAINPKTLMTFEIIVPSSIEEQTAIANVLSDMDTEISALETKLAKYRTLKTGMMQQLLTGKIRLV